MSMMFGEGGGIDGDENRKMNEQVLLAKSQGASFVCDQKRMDIIQRVHTKQSMVTITADDRPQRIDTVPGLKETRFSNDFESFFVRSRRRARSVHERNLGRNVHCHPIMLQTYRILDL